MSIISEALRKTQTNLKNTEQPNPSPTFSEKIKESFLPKEVQKPFFKKEKAKTSINNVRSQFVPQPQKTNTESHVDPKTKSKWITILLTGFIVASLIYLTVYFIRSIPFASFSVTFQSSPTPEKAPVLLSSQNIAAEPTNQQLATPQKPKLKLNGTMMMDSKRVALINDKIFEVGDNLNEFKIINITLEKVELLGNDELITLWVGQ